MKRNRERESGQTLVIVALALVALAGFAALAVDVGVMYTWRRNMQNAADAGALAGARLICHGETSEAVIRAEAIRYAVDENLADSAEVEVTADGVVRVTTSVNAGLFFAPVLGVRETGIVAEARAACSLSAAEGGGGGGYVQEETAWAANYETPLEHRYTNRGNWATYVDYRGFEDKGKTTNVYGGRTILIGTAVFSKVHSDPDGDFIYITIELSPPWEFQVGVGAHLKVQDYATAPSGNPAPGLFHYHEPNCTGQACTIAVRANNFYGVHLDVGIPKEIPAGATDSEIVH